MLEISRRRKRSSRVNGLARLARISVLTSHGRSRASRREGILFGPSGIFTRRRKDSRTDRDSGAEDEGSKGESIADHRIREASVKTERVTVFPRNFVNGSSPRMCPGVFLSRVSLRVTDREEQSGPPLFLRAGESVKIGMRRFFLPLSRALTREYVLCISQWRTPRDTDR